MALAIPLLAKQWAKEVGFGLLISLLFIALNWFFPQFTIGFPFDEYQSFEQDFLAVSVFAPGVEEIFFRFFLINFLLWAGVIVPVVVILSSVAFSAFHWLAYGASFEAQSGSFIGAAVFGIAAAVIALRRRSIIPTIILHFTFNTWLLMRLYGVI